MAAAAGPVGGAGGALLPATLPGASRAELAAIDAALRALPEPPAFETFTGTFATQEYLQATISQSQDKDGARAIDVRTAVQSGSLSHCVESRSSDLSSFIA